MKYGTAILLAVGCVLISGCGKKTSTPPLAVSFIGHIKANAATYRIRNMPDGPVFLQLQTTSAVGYYFRGRQLPGTEERELEVPVGQNLGVQATKLDVGQTMDFDVFYQSPRSFRVGILYSLYSDGGGNDWRLCWSGWFDDLGGREPATAPQRGKPRE